MLFYVQLYLFRFASPLAIVIFCCINSFVNFLVSISPFFEQFLVPIIDMIFVFNKFLSPFIYIFEGGFFISFNFSG